MKRVLLYLGVLIVAHPAPRPAIGQETSPVVAPQHAPVVTHHQGVFNGKKVAYTATVGETIAPNAAGKPAARIVTTAYAADGADPATRPVVFVCNGGPITPSSPLHMLALGPKRLGIPADLKTDPATFQVVDNTYTVLDAADIVFFDPASTGWSRVLDGVKPEEYYTTDADGQQFAAFVDRWLRDNNRMASPKYLLGESYATIRVPETAKQLLHLPQPIVLDGVFLMGQAGNQLEVNTRPYNIIAPVIGLPSVAATAWYHNKVDRKGRSTCSRSRVGRSRVPASRITRAVTWRTPTRARSRSSRTMSVCLFRDLRNDGPRPGYTATSASSASAFPAPKRPVWPRVTRT